VSPTLLSQDIIMNDDHGAGPVAPLPPGCASVSGREAPTMTLPQLMAAVGGAIRTGLPAEVWVQAQVLAARRVQWGWFLDLVEDQADNTVSCVRLSCSVSHAVLRRIGDELGFPLDPTLLIGSVALLKVKPTFHPRYQLGLRLLGVNGKLAAGLLARRIDQIRAALEGEGSSVSSTSSRHLQTSRGLRSSIPTPRPAGATSRLSFGGGRLRAS
jgi:hypothetical protein